MLKNIFIYLAVLVSVFVFSIFYYDWFSWFLLIVVLCVPLLSLALSLPFMILAGVNGVAFSAQKELTAEKPLCIRMVSRNNTKLFCPLIRIRFEISNCFAGQKKTVKFLYSGFIENQICFQTSSVTHNCGLVEIGAKYCKIYDLLGIFFIPVKLNYHAEVLVNPKPQEVNLPIDVVQNKIISYKKKPNGLAEEYELRNYQKGDSLKNIHWKISARHNDLVVKDPSTPIYRPLVLTAAITSGAKKNNMTLGKLLYSADALFENNVKFYFALPNGEVCEINDENDVKRYLFRLYKNEYNQDKVQTLDNPIIYKITHDTEAVSV